MNENAIVLASGNKGKLAEFTSLFEHYKVSVKPQSAFNIDDADETGFCFVENAIIKARHASAIADMPAIADDSGLVVEALNGAPGIYSARYAGQHGDDIGNYKKLLNNLSEHENRQAKFVCVLVYLRHKDDPLPIICQGEWHGQIAKSPSGSGGFGYDPVFYLPEHKCTAAELDKDIKNKVSHRGLALKALMNELRSLY